MKRFFLFCCLMVTSLFVVSQTRVSFTGVSLNGSYCPFDKVNVTNITKGWTETLVYPDTVLILSGLGVEECSSSREGIIRVYPNPFKDFTNVEFGISESGPIDVCVVGVDGVEVASLKGFIQAGVHQLRITLEKPQMAFVVITTEKEHYVGKLIHVGDGSVNEIHMCPTSSMTSGRSNGSSRSSASGDFTPGDMMSYEGVILNAGDEIYSNKVTKAQYGDETISLVFSVSGSAGEIQYLPYYQSFASEFLGTFEFGTYTTYDKLGSQRWMIDHNTAMMSGFANYTNYANEDWLISSPVSITGVDDAIMTICYIGRYFHTIYEEISNEEISVWASVDYVWDSDPATATWSQLPVTLYQGNNWGDFWRAEIALTDYVGQIVTFAVRYISSSNNAGAIEIQSITIEEGTAGGSPIPLGGLQSLPYCQSFATGFGTYMTYDVLGVATWGTSYDNVAHMSGLGANEDWLISSPVAVTDVSDAKVSVVYVARYQSSSEYDVTLQVSTDYNFGNDPTTATWTQMPVTFPNTSSWSDFQVVETSLNDFIGQNVAIAIKYTSTGTQSRTIEIQSITVQEGNGVTPSPGPDPDQGMGDGTSDDPYNVEAGICLQDQNVVAWVQGYIVGVVKSGLSSEIDNDDVRWVAPFELATNVVIADDPACHEISQCIIVNLPAGTPMRTAVNLVDHPENLGKRVSALGTLFSYFGRAGLCNNNIGYGDDFVLE